MDSLTTYCKLDVNLHHIIPINLFVIVKRDRNHLGCHCYLMKLWEGTVFTGVCLSAHGGPHVTITHDALDLTVQPPPPSDIW